MEHILQNKQLLQELEKFSLTATYPAGTRIAGKDLRSIPLLTKGMLKVMRNDNNGNNILLYYVNKDETCVVSMLQGAVGENCSIIAQVEEDAEIIFIPIDKAFEWMHRYPEWTQFILKSYYNRFEELLKALNSASSEKLETRVLRYLSQRRNIGGTKVINITHQHLASDLSTNRVVISRLLKSLENRGLVKLGRNKIEVAESV